MTVEDPRPVSRGRWRLAIAASMLMCAPVFILHLMMLGLSAFSWRHLTFAESPGFSLLAVSALLSFPVMVVALFAVGRAASAGRSGGPLHGARRLARLSLGLAVVATAAYAFSVMLVLAVTDPQPDGRWRVEIPTLLPAVQELAFNFAIIFLVFKTISLTAELSRPGQTTTRGNRVTGKLDLGR